MHGAKYGNDFNTVLGNSLRPRTGNFLRPNRELDRVIREHSIMIRNARFRRYQGLARRKFAVSPRLPRQIGMAI